jgi:hypothetical protein
MLKVPRPPGICPITGRTTDPEGFVDTGMDIPGFDPKLVLSVAGIRILAQTAGLPTVEQVEQLQRDLHLALAENEALKAHSARLEEHVGELEDFKRSVYVIESADFRAAKKRGPKPVERKAA